MRGWRRVLLVACLAVGASYGYKLKPYGEKGCCSNEGPATIQTMVNTLEECGAIADFYGLACNFKYDVQALPVPGGQVEAGWSGGQHRGHKCKCLSDPSCWTSEGSADWKCVRANRVTEGGSAGMSEHMSVGHPYRTPDYYSPESGFGAPLHTPTLPPVPLFVSCASAYVHLY